MQTNELVTLPGEMVKTLRTVAESSVDMPPLRELLLDAAECIEQLDAKPPAKSGKPSRANIPPTLEEVRAYCTERGGRVDAERFYDYYTSQGWRVGKNPMKDWRAAVRLWERQQYGEGAPTPTPRNGGSNGTTGQSGNGGGAGVRYGGTYL